MLTQTEQSLVDAVLRERDAPMVHIEARLQQNRATQLAVLVVALVDKVERLERERLADETN